MDESEKQYAVERYSKRLTKFGPSVQSLGWRNEEQQKLRFNVIKRLMKFPFSDSISVLDVGCGFGDFAEFLKLNGFNFSYEGCDISEEIIKIARKKNPDYLFKICDIRDETYSNTQFDYVIISGIFNHKIKNNEKFVRDILSVAYSICRLGVIANMTTDKVDYTDPELHYYNPGTLLDFCSENISRKISIAHDYPLYEFTVGIYKTEINNE